MKDVAPSHGLHRSGSVTIRMSGTSFAGAIMRSLRIIMRR